MAHREAHIFHAYTGHRMSRDCWCEPSVIYWIDTTPIATLVVEHEDHAHVSGDENSMFVGHHQDVIELRSAHPDAVTRLLDEASEKGYLC